MPVSAETRLNSSPMRAWGELLWLSIRRQARMRQMVWIALALLGLAVLAVGLITLFGSWRLGDRRVRMPPSRPQPVIYVAKYLAALPWCLGLNLLGFAAICLAGGEPGWLALRLFWPAVACGTLAYAALFHLIAALFRRPAVVGIVYSFFFEMLVG